MTSPVALTANSTISVTGTELTLSNTVSGAGGIDKTGAGTLILTAANTYTGSTTVDAGTLAITNAGALGSSSAGTTVNTGGTLDLRNVTGVAEPITLNGGTLATSTGTSSVTSPVALTANSTISVTGTSLELTNVISGSGGLTKTGSGILQLDAVNTYTGATTIDAGTLKLGANASIADSDKVTVNGTLDMSAITSNVYIQSLAGSGSVISGSIAPNALVITDAGDTFSGVLSGTGGLTIAGGTQTLTGINTYSGPTIVAPGANLIAGVQSIPGDITNNGSFGFNQSTPGSFTKNMSGSGTMVIAGTGPITLTGTNTQVGGTQINAGASLIVGSTGALSGNQIQSNGGSFGITDGIVLSSLGITGSVTLTSDIYTNGAQSYDNVKLAPSADNLTTLQTVNSDIKISGTLDATVEKIQSILINAGNAKVTFGDSVGSIARPNKLTATGSHIYILGDILTGDKQEYNGAISIGDGTYIGKAFIQGFLFNAYKQYFEYTQGGMSSTITYLNNDPRYVRTLISKDPNVTFNGTLDDVSNYTHTLLVAAIAPNVGSGASSSISFNSAVGDVSPLYSVNAQVIISNNLSAYVGSINITGGVATYSDQTYRSGVLIAQATAPLNKVTFSVYDPNAMISFLLPLQTNGQMNFQNTIGHADLLVFNGPNNYSTLQNTSGTGNWGTPAIFQPALGFVATTAPSTIPPSSQIAYQAILNQQIAKDIFSSAAQSYSSVSVEISDLSTSKDSNLVAPSGEGQLSSTGNEVFKPADDFINIKVNVVVDGGINTIISSVPKNMFAYKVPDILITNLIAAAPGQRGTSSSVSEFKVMATLSNDQPLPAWLKFDPVTKTFTSDKVPDGIESFEVKFKVFDANENVIGESKILIDVSKK